EIELKPRELVMTKGALGARIQSLLVKPPGFDPSKKYPALVLIHGGPQSAWDNAWSYRWNAQMFASHGYVVMMTNFHGSTGYGQRFVEEISRDWGGAPYQDLMLATDYLESLPYVDRTRIGAAGAGLRDFRRLAATRSAVTTALLPRRRALGAEGAEQPVMVQDGAGMVG